MCQRLGTFVYEIPGAEGRRARSWADGSWYRSGVRGERHDCTPQRQARIRVDDFAIEE